MRVGDQVCRDGFLRNSTPTGVRDGAFVTSPRLSRGVLGLGVVNGVGTTRFGRDEWKTRPLPVPLGRDVPSPFAGRFDLSVKVWTYLQEGLTVPVRDPVRGRPLQVTGVGSDGAPEVGRRRDGTGVRRRGL